MSNALIDALASLRDRGDRGALAALRRGLGVGPGHAPAMFPYVVPYLPDQSPAWTERAYFLIASLFAFHPRDGTEGKSLAAAMREVAEKTKSASIEARFVSMLDAHPDDLPNHLRHAVALARSKEVAVDWNLLLQHLLQWTHPDRWVQRRWARDFWGSNPKTAEAGAHTSGEGEPT